MQDVWSERYKKIVCQVYFKYAKILNTQSKLSHSPAHKFKIGNWRQDIKNNKTLELNKKENKKK